mmetsp:Transcript_47914/g.133574  ORF Transcript_47914/g.133574 Transcript_47914/m.133574 type:complete len:213 (-) Transcript_47914:119-757(-)
MRSPLSFVAPLPNAFAASSVVASCPGLVGVGPPKLSHLHGGNLQGLGRRLFQQRLLVYLHVGTLAFGRMPSGTVAVAVAVHFGNRIATVWRLHEEHWLPGGRRWRCPQRLLQVRRYLPRLLRHVVRTLGLLLPKVLDATHELLEAVREVRDVDWSCALLGTFVLAAIPVGVFAVFLFLLLTVPDVAHRQELALELRIDPRVIVRVAVHLPKL